MQQQQPPTVRPPKTVTPTSPALPQRKHYAGTNKDSLAHAPNRFRPPPPRFLRKLAGKR